MNTEQQQGGGRTVRKTMLTPLNGRRPYDAGLTLREVSSW
jgi:hypothetical protein